MNSSTFAVGGNWRRASSFADIDVEAQTITGTHVPLVLPTTPEPVRATLVPTCTSHGTTTNAIDDSFGVTRPRAMHESQHDSHLPLNGEPLPPPYADAELPAYTVDPDAEPTTLAMYLFKLGFLFPLLWILGAALVIFPLTAPADFEPAKSGTERQQLVQIIRDAELKWAQRCAWALFVLLVLGVVAVAIILAILYV